ncbi:MAG: response regulator [Glaciecola sp.]
MEAMQSVLIIDDDEDDIFLIQERLDEIISERVEYTTCHDKQLAINYLTQQSFDLCILDYRLSGFKGIDILSDIADIELATPIIMLTGQNDEDVAKQAIKLGAQDFVMKSLIDDTLFEKSIRYAVARKELAYAKMLSQRNEAENVAKDKFIAHLSHELRTPLTSILGYTSLLLEDESAAAFKPELGIISKNGEHLLSLLNDVLDLSKLAAGKFELREHEVELQQLLSDINALVVVNALDKGLSLTFSGLTKLPKRIVLDDLRFKQVLLNLISNAVKFTDTGGVKVLLSFKKTDNNALLNITVADTGIGMKASEQSAIFSPFKQLEDVSNRKAGGAGLGLSISAEIVKHMCGELKVSSSLGKGTEFTLTLPCEMPSDELVDICVNEQQVSPSQTLTPSLCGRVLVVDDLFEIRQLVGFYLRKAGLQVDFAENGQQALTMLGIDTNSQSVVAEEYDCVLMDLHMPVLTGQEAIVNIKQMYPSLPVIAMTAAIGKGLRVELVESGFTDLVAKPIDTQALWHTVEKTLKHSSAPVVHLVEDDVDSAQVMQMMLEKLGCSVIHSATGKQAQHNLARPNVDYHFLDLGLPDVSAKQILNTLTKGNHVGKVYVLSGQQPDHSLFREYPIVDQLIKPIGIKELREIVCA